LSQSVAMTDFSIGLVEAPTLDDRQIILDRLGAFNRHTAGPTGFGPVCIGIYDGEGALQGGLWGATLFAWLTIDLLFVPEELRGRGAGAELIARAEAEARGRGCIGAWLNTFSFQARGFYEKQGYRVFGEIADHPPGGARYFLQKRWDAIDAISPARSTGWP
jgi:GNAT superfamily N-acetyltransferase